MTGAAKHARDETGTAGTASRYVGDSGSDYWAYQEPIGRVVAQRDTWKIAPYLSRTDRVVEFGCGGGFLLERLSCGERIGIEVNASPRQAARERGLDVRASLDKVSTGWADVVWSHHVLEHVTDPFTALREMHRVLRSEGRLQLVLPIDDWRNSTGATEPDVNGHLWTWSPLLIHNLLAEVGFTDVKVAVVPYSWPRGSRIIRFWPSLYRACASLTGRVRRCRELHISALRS